MYIVDRHLAPIPELIAPASVAPFLPDGVVRQPHVRTVHEAVLVVGEVAWCFLEEDTAACAVGAVARSVGVADATAPGFIAIAGKKWSVKRKRGI